MTDEGLMPPEYLDAEWVGGPHDGSPIRVVPEMLWVPRNLTPGVWIWWRDWYFRFIEIRPDERRVLWASRVRYDTPWLSPRPQPPPR